MQNDTTVVSRKPIWLKRHGQKVVALLFWALLIGGYQWYAWSNQLSALEVVQRLLSLLNASVWGPVLFIGLYAIRPLILFPSTVLTLAGGFVFGPVLGVIYTLIAGNTSATVAYFVGRYFGQGLIAEGTSDSLIQRYATRLRQNSFETILVMRFIFLPFDLVNYLAGFLRIRWLPFVLATALGSIPGTLAFTWFGASIERLDGGLPALNPTTLAVSVAILVISLALSRLIKRRGNY